MRKQMYPGSCATYVGRAGLALEFGYTDFCPALKSVSPSLFSAVHVNRVDKKLVQGG